MRKARSPFSWLAPVALFALATPAHAEPSGEAHDAWPFRCDGTDPAFFEEIREAGWVGYGETWDFDTCEEGMEIYFPGTTSRWKAWRLDRSAAREGNVTFYSVVLPIGAFGSLGAIFGLAWLLAAMQQRRRAPVAVVACPSCRVEVPISLDDPASRSMFCPGCGDPFVIVDEGKGGRARARRL